MIDPEAPALARFARRLEAQGLYGDAEHAADAPARRRQVNALDPGAGLKIEMDLIIRKERPFSRSELDRAHIERWAAVLGVTDPRHRVLEAQP